MEVTRAAAHMQACTCQCNPGSVLSLFSTVAVTETPSYVLCMAHTVKVITSIIFCLHAAH